MASEEHLEILKQGVDAWNQWRKDNAEIEPDLGFLGQPPNEADLQGLTLHGADLGRTNLVGAILEEMDLREANFRLTNLSGAWLGNANLHEVDLSMANLYEAELPGAKLVEAILSKADLSRANLCGANLFGAHLPRANLQEANLQNVDLRGADLWRTNLTEADLTEANMFGANLTQAQLVGTNLSKANLASCQIFGISAWGLNLSECIQTELVITPIDEPVIRVDNLEVAQFIYLILNRQKLRSVLNAVMEKGVLILGRFGGGGIEVLQAVARHLREMDYVPIVFDFERPPNRTYTQTIQTLAGLSRFVIVDLSGPSVPQELYATVPHYKIPFVPIIEKGRGEYSLFVDLLENDNVLKPIVEFTSTSELVEMLPARIIEPAEKKHRDRQALLEQLFSR